MGLGVEVDTGTWPVPPIFSLIQARGDIADDEMVRTFNVGIGLTAVVAPGVVDEVLGSVPDAARIGRVVEVADGGPRVRFG
jgi:phosphoribosylformylglycinamidine cyclo-ligase